MQDYKCYTVETLLGFQQKLSILNGILYVFSLQRLQCYQGKIGLTSA